MFFADPFCRHTEAMVRCLMPETVNIPVALGRLNLPPGGGMGHDARSILARFSSGVAEIPAVPFACATRGGGRICVQRGQGLRGWWCEQPHAPHAERVFGRLHLRLPFRAVAQSPFERILHVRSSVQISRHIRRQPVCRTDLPIRGDQRNQG